MTRNNSPTLSHLQNDGVKVRMKLKQLYLIQVYNGHNKHNLGNKEVK